METPGTAFGTLKVANNWFVAGMSALRISVGNPLSIVTMPLSCQPPRIALATLRCARYRFPEPNGSSYPALATNTCGTSRGAYDFSLAKFQLSSGLVVPPLWINAVLPPDPLASKFFDHV